MSDNQVYEFRATTLRELGSAYIEAKSLYTSTAKMPERRATLVRNLSDAPRRGVDPKDAIRDARDWQQRHPTWGEMIGQPNASFFTLATYHTSERKRETPLTRFTQPDPTRLILDSPSYPKYVFYGWDDEEGDERYGDRLATHGKYHLGMEKKAVFMSHFYRGTVSLAATFDPALPICVPNPILQDETIQHMQNTNSAFLLPVVPSYTLGYYDWLQRTLGKNFAFLIEHKMRGNRYNLLAPPLAIEDLDELLDKFTRTTMPLEDYVRGLINNNNLIFSSGYVRTEDAPFTATNMASAAIATPSMQDRMLVIYLAYMAAVVSAKRSVMLIKAAVQMKDVRAYYASPNERMRGMDDAHSMPFVFNKTVDYLINSSLLVAPEQMHPSLSYLTPNNQSFNGAMHYLREEVRDTDDQIQALSSQLNADKAPKDLAYDHPFDFPMPEDDKERGSRLKIRFLAMQALVSKLDVLIDELDERLNRPFRSGTLVLRAQKNVMRYMNDALVNVWPSEIINGERVFIFNPLPPIVENVLVPESKYEQNQNQN